MALHVVAQGPNAETDLFKEATHKVASQIKKLWSDTKAEQMKKLVTTTMPAEGDKKQEAPEVEKAKFGWAYRELIIWTDKDNEEIIEKKH